MDFSIPFSVLGRLPSWIAISYHFFTLVSGKLIIEFPSCSAAFLV
jgi:hypothetical protein